MDAIILHTCALIAKHWLRSGAHEEKRELIMTKSFILKAERKYIRTDNYIYTLSTFSIHRKTKTNKWKYDKYTVHPSGRYDILRSGEYPYDWE